MAGNWIKVEFATADKPEILRLARVANISRTEAFGAAVLFWIWLDRNSHNGRVDGIVDADVDVIVGVSGFCAALQEVGWMGRNGDAFTVPHFSRLNGQSAKNRALKNERQARWRDGKDNPKPAAKEAPTGRFEPPEWVPRQEWEAWIEMRKAKRAKPTAHALGLAVSELEKLQAEGHAPISVLRQSIMNSWTGLFPLKQADRLAVNGNGAPHAGGSAWWSSDALMVNKAHELGISSAGLARDELKRKIETAMEHP